MKWWRIIRFLHKNTCLDMNDFNFMIGFEYNSNGLLTALTEEEQVTLFKRMHEEFDGTDLDMGVNGAWFNEFGPEYCTNCDNCGEKFFLLEKNGDIYSCVRGQKNKDYFYGNIFQNSVTQIMDTARTRIFMNHNKMPFSEECADCDYLYICKTGCPFVKNTYQTNKSYTCRLQLELYKQRNYPPHADKREAAYLYTRVMHPDLIEQYLPERNDLVKVDMKLMDIIQKDSGIKYIYDPEVFILKVDEREYRLQSQILRYSRDIIYLTPESKIYLYLPRQLLSQQCEYPNNNSLYMMCLSGDMIQYGDAEAEISYLEEAYVPHKLVGVIAENK